MLLFSAYYLSLFLSRTHVKLSEESRQELFNVGFQLWQYLIDILQPDIILVSIAKHLLKQLRLTNKIEFEKFDKKRDDTDRAKPYIIHQYDLLLNKGESKVYFGQAAEKPFGTLSSCFKQKLGRKILTARNVSG